MASLLKRLTVLAGRSHESDMVLTLDFWERINNEAVGLGIVFHIHVIADRGFRDNRDYLDAAQRDGSWPYKNLRVSVELPEHLGTKEEPKRAQHETDEVITNRDVQGKALDERKGLCLLQNCAIFHPHCALILLASHQLVHAHCAGHGKCGSFINL